MSSVRVLVGTRKGAFVLTSDEWRRDWQVSGPHFAGWEIYHIVGSPADPNRLYASQSGGWFGQIIQRSDDGGKTWAFTLKDGLKWEDGKEYPLIKLEISNTSHPFYTGKMKLVDTAGRVDKYMNRYKTHLGNKK